jgi:DNA helicase-2/ATP-dependent DNA helicase PcrA
MLELNPEQIRAIRHGRGPLLIVAGPGTGKTRVITQRIVHLIQEGAPSDEEGSLHAENILALTFTEKAAEEMKRRVAAALPGLEKLPAISTFHAFCLHVLRRHHVDRLLLDKIDVWIFLRRRMAELGLEFYQKLAEPGAFLHDLNEFFSRCQDDLIEPEDFECYVSEFERQFFARHPHLASVKAALNSAPRVASAAEKGILSLSPEEHLEWEEVLKKRELASVFRRSRQLIGEAGASSLGSLVSETVALWKRNPAALAEARSQYQAVLVDEFQDTNYAQVELLKLLSPPPYFITAVGDDDQAIYRFRGASHGAFEMFTQAFPGHEIVYLTRSYRSTRRVLRVSAAVIARNDRYAHKPTLISSKDEGPPVYLVKSHNPLSEAVWIADEIERLAKQGISFGDIAVLYRAHSYRDSLVEELRRRMIPFTIRGLSLLSATVLRDLTAYLELIHSPHENISLTRALLAPCWRFPETLAQAIRQQAAKDRCSLYDVLRKTRLPHLVHELASTGWKDLDKLLKDMRRFAKRASVTEVMDRLIERLGWTYLEGDAERIYLETFRKFLGDWEEKSETRKLAEFMEYFKYFLEAGGKIEWPETAQASNAVQMMTVHAAKGLEFLVVFAIGLSSRRFPVTERKPVIEFPAVLRKGPPPPADIHLQEERRLFFVALTRAQDRLYISSVARTERQQSRFINDLLSDAMLATRDLEIIEAPDALAGGLVKDARASTGLSSQEIPQPARVLLSERAPDAGQRHLFENLPANGNGLHPVLENWVQESLSTPSSEKLRLSATSAEDYLGCPLKYKFQHLLKIPTAPQAALTFGNLMHQTVRHYFELRRSTLPRFEEIEQFYLDHWQSVGFDDDYQEETYRKTGLEQLRGFIEKHNPLAIDCQKMRWEKSFSLDLDDLILEGRIDQINFVDSTEPNAVELIDYKTGRPRTEKDAENSLQLSVYALAAQRTLGLNPVRLTFYNLTSNEAVSTVRTSADLATALERIREVASAIRAGGFDPKPGFGCRWCDYLPLCPAHED